MVTTVKLIRKRSAYELRNALFWVCQFPKTIRSEVPDLVNGLNLWWMIRLQHPSGSGGKQKAGPLEEVGKQKHGPGTLSFSDHFL